MRWRTRSARLPLPWRYDGGGPARESDSSARLAGPGEPNRGTLDHQGAPDRAHGPQATETDPPAASIFSLAEAENAWAVTSTLTERSPWPSTLTGWPLRTAPLATSSSTVTWPPSGKSALIRSRLTTWNSTRKGFLKPFSLGRRMCSG